MTPLQRKFTHRAGAQTTARPRKKWCLCVCVWADSLQLSFFFFFFSAREREAGKQSHVCLQMLIFGSTEYMIYYPYRLALNFRYTCVRTAAAAQPMIRRSHLPTSFFTDKLSPFRAYVVSHGVYSCIYFRWTTFFDESSKQTESSTPTYLPAALHTPHHVLSSSSRSKRVVYKTAHHRLLISSFDVLITSSAGAPHTRRWCPPIGRCILGTKLYY